MRREALGVAARRTARAAVGALAPGLLRKIQRARAQARYTHPPRRGPRRVLLEATTACNYRCLMCTDHGPLVEENTPAKLMPWERTEGLLRELAAMGTKEVWLAGRGEPLTHPQAGRIVALATSLGMQSMVTTNAGLLTDALADELCDAGLTTLSISINSGCPQTYADVHGARPGERARILALMKRVSQRPRHPWLFASMVLLKPNLAELPTFVEEAIGAGATVIDVLGLRFAEMFPTLALNEDEWAQARRGIAAAKARAEGAGAVFSSYCIPPDPATEEERRPAGADRSHWGLGCFVGYQFVRIDVDGHAHGCCSCSNDLGQLSDGSFAELWRSPRYERFRQVCRAMPATRVAPPACNCRDCGNVLENEAVHRELQFAPLGPARDEGLASRLDLARIAWEHLGDLLPRSGEAEGYGDLTPEQAGDAWTAVAGLQAAGVMTGYAAGRPQFRPDGVATHGETMLVLERIASLLGIGTDAVHRAADAAAPGLRGPDPLVRSELEHWARAVRAEVSRASAR